MYVATCRCSDGVQNVRVVAEWHLAKGHFCQMHFCMAICACHDEHTKPQTWGVPDMQVTKGVNIYLCCFIVCSFVAQQLQWCMGGQQPRARGRRCCRSLSIEFVAAFPVPFPRERICLWLGARRRMMVTSYLMTFQYLCSVTQTREWGNVRRSLERRATKYTRTLTVSLSNYAQITYTESQIMSICFDACSQWPPWLWQKDAPRQEKACQDVIHHLIRHHVVYLLFCHAIIMVSIVAIWSLRKGRWFPSTTPNIGSVSECGKRKWMYVWSATALINKIAK